MKIKLEIFLILVHMLVVTHTLKSNHICQLTETKCEKRNSFNHSSSIFCKISKCEAPLKFSCSENFCTTNLKACDKFVKLKYKFKDLNEISNKNIEIKNIFEAKTEQLKKFIGNIKNCATWEIFHIKTPLICSNGKNCRLVKQFYLRHGPVAFVSTVNCKCKDAIYKFKCGPDYCAANELECFKFRKLNALLNATLPMMEIESCNNDFMFLKLQNLANKN